MKTTRVLLVFVFFCLTSLHCIGQTEKELKSRKIRIVTADNQTIVPSQVLLSDSTLKYVSNEVTDSLAYGDITYIYIKEGSNFPKIMGICISLGLGYGVIYGLFSMTGTFIGNIAIGLAAGVIAGLIVAPFTMKPEKLIFYKGKWTDSKYAP